MCVFITSNVKENNGMVVFHESELELQRDEDASKNYTGKLLPLYSIKFGCGFF